MDCAPNVNIFRELQVVHDTGYFSGQISPEEDWQQVYKETKFWLNKKLSKHPSNSMQKALFGSALNQSPKLMEVFQLPKPPKAFGAS